MPAVFSSLSFAVIALIAIIMAVVAISSASAQSDPLPKIIDWRTKGVLGPVVNQGQCGAAAIFAAVSNIQAVSAITNKKFVNLSHAEFMTCLPNACNGGLITDPFKWVLEHGGRVAPAGTNITKEDCQNTAKLPLGARVESIRTIFNSEFEIHRSLVSGPVTVAVDADSWETYIDGVLASCPANNIDDAALVVGINLEAPVPYWILQSSWGSDWGENGYIRIKYGSNECGITDHPLTVTCAKL